MKVYVTGEYGREVLNLYGFSCANTSELPGTVIDAEPIADKGWVYEGNYLPDFRVVPLGEGRQVDTYECDYVGTVSSSDSKYVYFTDGGCVPLQLLKPPTPVLLYSHGVLLVVGRNHNNRIVMGGSELGIEYEIIAPNTHVMYDGKEFTFETVNSDGTLALYPGLASVRAFDVSLVGPQPAATYDLAREFLDGVYDLMTGDRASDYGDPHEMHKEIAARWGATSAAKVALDMVDMKMARLRNTPDHEDSMKDLVAYMAFCYAFTQLEK